MYTCIFVKPCAVRIAGQSMHEYNVNVRRGLSATIIEYLDAVVGAWFDGGWSHGFVKWSLSLQWLGGRIVGPCMWTRLGRP